MSMTRERIVELVKQMRHHTIENGCTPGEAAKFAAKCAELVEKYQIEEAELRERQTGKSFSEADMEVCENILNTGKSVFNPGMTQVVNALAESMCCKCIMDHRWNEGLGVTEAVYGITGDGCDADWVCQIALSVVPALQQMARLEGIEHGYEKAGLVRWGNQYLMGAAVEIRKRIEQERSERSSVREAQALPANKGSDGCTALAVVTGDSIAIIKKGIVAEVFKEKYPKARTARSRSEWNGDAYRHGKEAGNRVGLNIAVE